MKIMFLTIISILFQRLSKYVETVEFDVPNLVDEGFMARLKVRAALAIALLYPDTVSNFMDEWRVEFYMAGKNASLQHQYKVATDEERSHFLGLQIFLGAKHITPSH